MKPQFGVFAFATLVLLSACQSSGEIIYTGEREDALEGEYIKDPEAVGSTRNRGNQNDTTRTESNRVDIPVLEFAQFQVTSRYGAAYSRAGLDARFTRSGFGANKLMAGYERRMFIETLTADASNAVLTRDTNLTLFPGMKMREQLNSRSSSERVRAYSAQEMSLFDTGQLDTGSISAREMTSAMASSGEVEAIAGRTSYESAFAQRIVGLHLWKYADREIVGDDVEVTYTIVYYNTNEFDTGPTEIDEPVPYYTEYLDKSATLPKSGTTVEYLPRKDNRNILRWKFPKGIQAGETNKMTYKVRVRLSEQYAPRDDTPGISKRQ